MTRAELAAAAGISLGPIKQAETEGHVPKAPTLRAIARGLATYGGGRRDDDLADDYYRQLMGAAELSAEPPLEPPSKSRPVEDLTDEEVEEALTNISQDAELSAAFLAVAEDWTDLPTSSRRMVLSTLRAAVERDEKIKTNARRISAEQRAHRSPS